MSLKNPLGGVEIDIKYVRVINGIKETIKNFPTLKSSQKSKKNLEHKNINEMALLNKNLVEEKLKELPGWKLKDNYIEKVYETKNFKETMIVVNLIAGLAESHFHHPDVEFGYKKIVVKLTTHSEGGVTEKDIKLAQDIEKFTSQIVKK